MNKIAIITDSSCDLSADFVERFNIFIVPLMIIYQDAEYRDRIDITADQVYDRFTEEIPTTSLPSAEQFKDVVDQIVEQGYDEIVGIFLSAGLSGTYNIARQYFELEKRIPCTLFDSKSLSLGLGFVVMRAAEAIKQKMPVQELYSNIKHYIEHTKCFYVVKTLEYLRKGGRIGQVEGTIGELLNVKPIISINERGVYYTYKKVRGRKRSINEIIEIVKSYGKKKINLAVMHGAAEEEARYAFNLLKDWTNIAHIEFGQISPVLTVHTGPGLIGVIIQEVQSLT